MPGLLMTGVNSEIAKALKEMMPVSPAELTRGMCDMKVRGSIDGHRELIQSSSRIFMCHGELSSDEFGMRSRAAIDNSAYCNLWSVVQICEIAFANDRPCRICVMGSESARKGSHDTVYWLAKAALHEYVRNRRLTHPGQQLVAVAPSMIADTGMTKQKPPQIADQARRTHRLGRLAHAEEVARLIHFLLFTDEGYISNTVVQIDGGKFTGSGI